MHKTSVKLDSWTQAGRQAAERALSCLEGRSDPFSRTRRRDAISISEVMRLNKPEEMRRECGSNILSKKEIWNEGKRT